MTYSGKEVFQFPINWASAVKRTVTFDLRPEEIGFGAEYFTITQAYTVNNWSFDCDLNTANIKAFDDFIDAVYGRTNSFWLPVPVDWPDVVGTGDVGGTKFYCPLNTISTYWNEKPTNPHIELTYSDGVKDYVEIISISQSGGYDEVTLQASATRQINAGTTVRQLNLVRLDKDVEDGEFYTEGRMTRSVSVVELPNELISAALNIQPIYLFHFWANAPAQNDWRYTSFAASVVSNNLLYTNFPINFSGLSNVLDLSQDNLKIEAKYDATHPFSLFLPMPFSGTLYVEVMAVDYDDLDTQTMLFSGRVVSVEDGGTKLTADCESRLGFLRRKIPRYLKGENCQNILYDQNTCKVGRAYFETTASIDTINTDRPQTILVTPLFAAFATKFFETNYLQNGQIEAGTGTNYETRSIIASKQVGSQIQITVNIPFSRTVAGVNAQITAGCDHTETMCQNRFNNYQNFNGFVAIPSRNPCIKAVNSNSVAQGGK